MSDHIGILSRFLQSAGARHGALASNIANVDTPGYKAKDVKFEQVMESEASLVTTSPRHLSAGGPPAGTGAAGVQEREGPSWADGNNIELDQEVARLTENALLFEAGISLLSTKMRMFKTALRSK